MRQADFDVAGVSLSMDNDTFWMVSESPLQVLSSSVIGGELKETRHIMSVRVPDDASQREFALKRPRAYLRERAQALGNQEPVVGLITTMDHERLQVSIHAEGEIKVAALATVGLTHLSAPGRHNVIYTGEQQAGTINLVVLADARLSPEAEVRAATLATEAKTLALFEADVKTVGGSIATGTSMDTIIVASTGRGPFFRYSGTSTLLGHLIGQAVYEVVAAGIRVDQESQVKSQ